MGNGCCGSSKNKPDTKSFTNDRGSFADSCYRSSSKVLDENEKAGIEHPMANYVFPRKSIEKKSVE